jgi:hypothetical protein
MHTLLAGEIANQKMNDELARAKSNHSSRSNNDARAVGMVNEARSAVGAALIAAGTWIRGSATDCVQPRLTGGSHG